MTWNFHRFFHRFSLRNRSQNWWFFGLLSKTSLSQKLVFRLGENHFFQVRSLEKSVQNVLKNDIEKKREKRVLNLHENSLEFGLSWTSWAPRGEFFGVKNPIFVMRSPTYSPRGLLVASESDFKGFRMDLGRIWGRFLEDFGRISRIVGCILRGLGRDLGTFEFILKEIWSARYLR